MGSAGVDLAMLHAGMVLCHADFPARVVRSFQARIVALDLRMPILKGAQVGYFCGADAKLGPMSQRWPQPCQLACFRGEQHEGGFALPPAPKSH